MLALMFFLYGLLLSASWDISLHSEIANSVAIILLWIATINRPFTQEGMKRVVNWFMVFMILVAIILALLGLIKFLLFLRGHRLAFVEAASAGRYPWGTSLTVDYNMYALSILAGAIGTLSWLLSTHSTIRRIVASGLFIGLCVVGFLAGSRRFWIIAPVSFALLTLGLIRQRNGSTARRGFAVLFIMLAVGAVALYKTDTVDWNELMGTGWDLQYRLATLLDAESSGGMEGRFSRWQFSLHLLTDMRVWVGNGFDYLSLYSCKFEDCSGAGYPHNPLISALLYAGVPGMLSVLALVLYFMYCGMRLLLMDRGMPFLGTLLIVHLPFTMISSNGPFAVKSIFVIGLLCSFYLWQEMRYQEKDGSMRLQRLFSGFRGAL
ncbi:hypothetical protein ACG33_04775 [Steroidobacter denitrificans]|uniref:O-antigen polymerase n=1 Tax=Steroidobacter denitrificans TaxID=465721 RepID=A0A127F7P0_STEDE|nr:hypothetical protein ACG33_04775 [Steroidobacter denitrificans]